MTWKKKRVGVCVVALAACLIWMPQETQANAPAPSTDAPYHVVEGGDFRMATTTGDRHGETYRLSKYDVISVQVIGFNSALGNGAAALDSVMIGPDGYAQLPYAGS